MQSSTKKIIFTIFILLAGAAVVAFIFKDSLIRLYYKPTPSVIPSTPTVPSSPSATTSPNTSKLAPLYEVVARNLDIPWEIVFLPNGEMLVTERPGTLKKIGKETVEIPIVGVRHTGEGGLLGLVLHPNFTDNHWLYLYLTTKTGDSMTTRVERYEFENDKLSERKVIIEGIPGAIYHDGGRMAFGSDGYLYITTGDATQSNLAQDKNSLAGKILRLKDDGTIPADNPFGTAVYSYGHRNPQGIAWDDKGRLWENEHGRSGVVSGMDEVNLIEKGANYGWPTIEGDKMNSGMQTPIINSGANETWAPAGLVYFKGKLWFTGLRGESLYAAAVNADGMLGPLKAYFRGTFGRLRALTVGPDGLLYISTSNTDGRGKVAAGDDKIIRVDPAQLQ